MNSAILCVDSSKALNHFVRYMIPLEGKVQVLFMEDRNSIKSWYMRQVHLYVPLYSE